MYKHTHCVVEWVRSMGGSWCGSWLAVLLQALIYSRKWHCFSDREVWMFCHWTALVDCRKPCGEKYLFVSVPVKCLVFVVAWCVMFYLSQQPISWTGCNHIQYQQVPLRVHSTVWSQRPSERLTLSATARALFYLQLEAIVSATQLDVKHSSCCKGSLYRHWHSKNSFAVV